MLLHLIAEHFSTEGPAVMLAVSPNLNCQQYKTQVSVENLVCKTPVSLDGGITCTFQIMRRDGSFCEMDVPRAELLPRLQTQAEPSGIICADSAGRAEKSCGCQEGQLKTAASFFFFFLPTSFFPAIVSPYIKFCSFCFCFCFMVWDLSNDFRTCVPHALWLLWFSIRSHNLSWTICFSREKRQSKWKVKMFIAQYYFKSRCHFLLTSQVRERNKTKSKTSK